MLITALVLFLQVNGDPIKLTPREKLPGALLVPVVFSHDGAAILYYKQPSKNVIVALADENGKPIRDIFTSPVDVIDMHIASAGPGVFGPEGKRIAAFATQNDKLHRSGDPACVAIIEGDKVSKVEAAENVFAYSFAGEKLLFIEQSAQKLGGYRLRSWFGGAAETIHESKAAEVAMTLRVSPDGTRAAFLVYAEDKRFRLRVVDLKLREVTDSEKFPTEDVTFSGPPLIFWDVDSAAIFYHRTPGGGDRKPWALERYDVVSKKSETIFNGNNVGVVTVIDKDWLAVIANDAGRGGLLRRSDRKFFPLPAAHVVLGATSKRIVVGDADNRSDNPTRGEVKVYEYEVPK